MRSALVIAAAMIVMAQLAGCEPSTAAPTGNNPLLVESEFEPLFLAAGRTLRDHRFTIFREDAIRGEIVTDPLTGQQMWEFWRSDAAGLYNQMESSLHTILRSVQVRVWPARDAAGQQIPGKHYLEVRAYTDRLSVPEQAFTAANQLPTDYKVGRGLVNALELEEEHAARPRRVFLRRDGMLEDWLVRNIVKLAGAGG